MCKNREEPRRTRCERRAGVSPCVSWSVPSRTRTIPHRGTVTYNPVFRKPHDGWSIHSPQHATSGVTGRLQQGPNFSFLWFCNPFAHFTVSGDLPKTPACSCQTVHEPSSRVPAAHGAVASRKPGHIFPLPPHGSEKRGTTHRLSTPWRPLPGSGSACWCIGQWLCANLPERPSVSPAYRRILVSSFPLPTFLLRCPLTRHTMSQPRGQGGSACARNDSFY